MRKELLLVVLLVGIVAVALGACGGAAPASTTDLDPLATTQAKAAAAKPAGPVEVIWYVRTNDKEQPWERDVVIPDFEAKNPNIKINLVVVTWDDFDTKMQTMVAAGTPPDIWSHWGPSGFIDYVKRGMAADLTPFIEKDSYDLADFIPEVLSIYTLDGKIYGLPMLTTGSFIFYNKDLFDAAGVKYPPTNWDDTTWTWDAFVKMCGQLTKNTDDPQKAVFGCNLGAWPNDQYAWIFGQDLYPDSAYQTGFADTAFLDGEGALKGFQARQDMVWKYHYMPDPAETDALGGGNIFQSGKVAMHLTGGWGWWNFSGLEKQFKWGVAALPYGAPGRKDVVFTDPWLMSATTKHPEEAWEFLKYLVSAKTQEQWMKVAGAPPVRKSLAEAWYKQFPTMTPEEVEELHLGALKYGRESPNHLLVRFDQLNQVVAAAIDPIVNNEKKAADVLPDANTKLIEALKQIAAENKK